MPGSEATSCFFAACFLALLEFFVEGDVVRNWRGLKGCDWLRELMMISQMTAWDKDDESGDG